MRRGLAVGMLATALAMAGTTVSTPGTAGAVTGHAVTAAPARSAGHAGEVASLRQRINAALGSSTAGRVAYRFDIGGVGSVEHEATRMQRPASNNKLFIGEVALQLLGPGYRFTTGLDRRGVVRDGVLDGHLVVVASGDPTLSDTGLRRLARATAAAGVHRVTGGLVVDTAGFEHRTTAPGWHAGFTPSELGPVDGFAVDGNGWQGGTAYLGHTAVDNGGRLVSAMRRAGVKIQGGVRLGGAAGRPLASVSSAPLSSIVAGMLTDSINFDAEMLLDDIGALGPSHVATRTAGLAELRSVAAGLGVTVGKDYDGSGLSYDDRESPTRLVQWLTASAASAAGEVLRAALPVSCESGTLTQRLCGPVSRGKVFAKTGTLSHTSTLSGWTTTAEGSPVTFSVMLDDVGNIGEAETGIDAAIAVVTHS